VADSDRLVSPRVRSLLLGLSVLVLSAWPGFQPAFAQPPALSDEALLFDSLDDEAAGWLPSAMPEDSPFQVGYQGGEYRIWIPEPGEETLASVWVPGSYPDVDVSVDARLVGGTSNRYLALACRSRGAPETHGYRLSVYPDQRSFSLLRTDAGGPVFLVSWRPSVAVQRGAATNQLGLSCSGDTLGVRINGVLVASVEDDAWRGWGSDQTQWIGASSFEGRTGVDARFSNLVLREP
jgi:hypothetical protein